MIAADRVKETTATTGTGTVNLAGPSTGFQGFVAGVGNGNVCQYCIVAGSEWEVGIGTVTDAATDTLSRTTVLASSNAGALVNFSAGTKDVFLTVSAKRLRQFPDSKPVTPTTYDDEFESEALNARWTAVTSPDGTFTLAYAAKDTFLSMKSLGHATNNQLVLRQALGVESDAAVAVGYTVKLGLSAYGTGLRVTDFLIGDNVAYATGNYVLFALQNVSSSYEVQVYDGAVINTTVLGAAMGSVYIHVQRTTGNVLNVYISLDGIGWRRIVSVSKTFNFDYLFIRLYGSITATEISEHLVDFVRVNDPRFTQQV